MKLEKDFVIFAGSWKLHKEQARARCRKLDLTAEDVKLVKRGEQICAVLKRDIDFERRKSGQTDNDGSQ